MMRLYVDTDIGSEMSDAAALAVLASASETYLCGVGTVTGDTGFRARAAYKLLSMLGKPEVPVVAGVGGGSEIGTWEDGMWDAVAEHSDPRSAAELLVQMANRYPYQLTVAAIGPLTNIAAALSLEPRLPKLLRRLVVMGGMFEPPYVEGFVIPRGFEYNFCTDSSALQRVLAAGFQLTILPGDLTFRADDPWTEDELTELSQVDHPAVHLLSELARQSLPSMRAGLISAGFSPELARIWANDELLAAYLLKPSLFAVKQLSVRLELPDKYPRFVEDQTGSKVTLIVDADFPAARHFVLERLRWIADGPPLKKKTDVDLALDSLMAAEPNEREHLFKEFCRRVVERQRRRSSSVNLSASVIVYAMASSLSKELMQKYAELWKLVCDLETPREPEATNVDPNWLRLTDLIDALFQPDLQPVVDAYGVGRVQQLASLGQYHVITTKLGRFVAVETGRQHVKSAITPEVAAEEIARHYGKAEPCLTVFRQTAGFHRQHRHFLLYRIIRPKQILPKPR